MGTFLFLENRNVPNSKCEELTRQNSGEVVAGAQRGKDKLTGTPLQTTDASPPRTAGRPRHCRPSRLMDRCPPQGR